MSSSCSCCGVVADAYSSFSQFPSKFPMHYTVKLADPCVCTCRAQNRLQNLTISALTVNYGNTCTIAVQLKIYLLGWTSSLVVKVHMCHIRAPGAPNASCLLNAHRGRQQRWLELLGSCLPCGESELSFQFQPPSIVDSCRVNGSITTCVHFHSPSQKKKIIL